MIHRADLRKNEQTLAVIASNVALALPTKVAWTSVYELDLDTWEDLEAWRLCNRFASALYETLLHEYMEPYKLQEQLLTLLSQHVDPVLDLHMNEIDREIATSVLAQLHKVEADIDADRT